MSSTLTKINDAKDLKLSVAVTGMHLNPKFGETKKEVVNFGFDTHIVESVSEDGSRLTMVNAVATQTSGFSELFSSLNPSIILLLGDRGEMLAAAIAALYLNIPVVHIHGGELSGTVDESIRHAISKLSHFHFVSTKNSRERLIRMGEEEKNIYVTGAPGLDDIINTPTPNRGELIEFLEINNPITLLAVVFHPVVQDAEMAGQQTSTLLRALPVNQQIVILMPNGDAGGQLIHDEIFNYAKDHQNVKLIKHLPRNMYLSLIANCDVLIGNSSSGIIEAASFATRVINVGERQANRERNLNTFDVGLDTLEIKNAIQTILLDKKPTSENVYGDGHSGERICQLLSELVIDANVTRKCNAY
jgi:GDP/UDP-N,N'-diacetylbacillosamine 2-epimerase (hydrolysing)